MSYKTVVSALAIALTFYAFYPYILGILRGAIKPHVFSWVIWGSTTFVVAFAQGDADGGAGAWAVGVSGAISLVIAALAYAKRADVGITASDWAFFLAAMSSLPVWYLTADPLGAVIVLTVVDLLGFGPTLRKVHASPYSESAGFFALFLVRNLLVIVALESYSAATVLYPALVALGCAGIIAVILWRRRSMGPELAS